MIPRSTPTRRTGGVRTSERSARIVEHVLRSTVEEIGRSGYAALRVEDVAARSGVNKTTIYRRWPTKVELVAAAIRASFPSLEPPDTGSLREDLLVLLKAMVQKTGSPLGKGIVRMVQTERAHPEVEQIMQPLTTEQMRLRRSVVERAIERGELPVGTDTDLVAELAFAPIFRRVVHANKDADDAFMESAVDVVLAGARTGAAVRRAGSERPAGARRGRR